MTRPTPYSEDLLAEDGLMDDSKVQVAVDMLLAAKPSPGSAAGYR